MYRGSGLVGLVRRGSNASIALLYAWPMTKSPFLNFKTPPEITQRARVMIVRFRCETWKARSLNQGSILAAETCGSGAIVSARLHAWGAVMKEIIVHDQQEVGRHLNHRSTCKPDRYVDFSQNSTRI